MCIYSSLSPLLFSYPSTSSSFSFSPQVPSALIASLLSHYAGDSSLTTPLTAQLRQLCSSLFSQEDAIASKGQELVTIATSIESPAEKQSMLRDSLKVGEKEKGGGGVFISFSFPPFHPSPSLVVQSGHSTDYSHPSM